MNNRWRLTRKTENLPGVRQLRIKEIDSMQEEAIALKEQQDYADELDLRKKIISKTTKYYGEDSLETFDAMSELALSYQDLYRFDEALAIRRDTLKKCKKIFGEHHEATATAMYNMSNTLNAMGKYRKALSFDYEVYMSRLSLLGTDDEETLSAVMNYAASFANVGEYKTAFFFYKQNYENSVSIYGKNSPQAMLRLAGIASVLDDLERYKEALSLWECVKQYNEEHFGKKGKKALYAMRRIALTLNSMGQHEEANNRLEQLSDKETQEFEKVSSITQSVLTWVLLELGQYDRAISLLEDLLQKRKETYGEKHPAFGFILNRLAYAYHLIGNVKKAESCVGKLEQILADEIIENAEDYIETQDTLVLLYIDLGEYEKATALAEKMIDSAEYHYYYKKAFLARRYDTAKLAFEKAGDLDKAKECEYKKTHMNELVYSGKPLCGMKLRAKEDEGATSLTKDKVYELLSTEKIGNNILYSIIDDEEFIPYLYAPEQFEVMEDGEEEPFELYKETVKVTTFQQIPLCDYNDMKATILEDGTFHVSGVDKTWKGLAFMTFDDDGNDKDDYDFDYEFSKRATKILFALLHGKDPDEVETDADLKEILNLDVIKKRFASKEGVDCLFEFCKKHSIEYTRRNY